MVTYLIALLPYRVTTLSRYYLIALLPYRVTTLSRYYLIASLPYRVTTLSRYYLIALLPYRVTALSRYYLIALLPYRVTTLSRYYLIALLPYRVTTLSRYYLIALLPYRVNTSPMPPFVQVQYPQPDEENYVPVEERLQASTPYGPKGLFRRHFRRPFEHRSRDDRTQRRTPSSSARSRRRPGHASRARHASPVGSVAPATPTPASDPPRGLDVPAAVFVRRFHAFRQRLRR